MARAVRAEGHLNDEWLVVQEQSMQDSSHPLNRGSPIRAFCIGTRSVEVLAFRGFDVEAIRK